jgi:hypothetical protein
MPQRESGGLNGERRRAGGVTGFFFGEEPYQAEPILLHLPPSTEYARKVPFDIAAYSRIRKAFNNTRD